MKIKTVDYKIQLGTILYRGFTKTLDPFQNPWSITKPDNKNKSYIYLFFTTFYSIKYMNLLSCAYNIFSKLKHYESIIQWKNFKDLIKIDQLWNQNLWNVLESFL